MYTHTFLWYERHQVKLTTAPQTKAKCILGSNVHTNFSLGSPGLNCGFIEDGCGLLPEI
jgi:hypothetical protein